MKRKAHRATPGVVDDGRAFGQPGLLEIGVIGFDAARSAPVANMFFCLWVQCERHTRCGCHQFRGEVILCGPQPAVHDHDAGVVGCPLERRYQPLSVISQCDLFSNGLALHGERLRDHG